MNDLNLHKMRKLEQEDIRGPDWKHEDPGYLPVERKVAYDYFLNQGHSVQQLADKYRITVSYVEQIINKNQRITK